MTMEHTSRTPRWIKVALLVSLSLNLVVVGAIVGARGFGPVPGASERMGGPMGGGGALARALSSEDRKALRETLGQDRDQRRENRRAMRAMRAEIVAQLRATPFDPAALAQALEAQSQLGQSLAARGQGALLQRISEMSDAERAAYADRIEASGQRRKPKP